MNPFFKQFHTHAHQVRLTSAERSRVRLALREAMHPAPGAVRSPYVMPSPFFFRMSGAFALVLIVLFGGTAYAAEGSLPGDALYPIKIHVTEPLQGAFVFSD